MSTTEQHKPETAEQGPTTSSAWIVAFPEPRAIPAPPRDTEIGRDYFAEHGHTDKEISGKHFRLVWRGSTAYIEDIGSRNGTWLNGHRIDLNKPVKLTDGMIVRLGNSLFLVREALRGPLTPDPDDGELVGPWGLRALRDALTALRVSRPRAVMIQGETGTGKELVARAVARALDRDKHFAAVNVAALSKDALEGHLFGWVKGAFTGADRTEKGLIRSQDGGALFLDEIGELPFNVQVKLLRAIENQEVLPIGANKPERPDVLFVAATNRDLDQMVSDGSFRRDLFARFPARLQLPPLRDRPEDLYSILRACWSRQFGPIPPTPAKVPVEAVEALLLHDWPNNVRDVDRWITDKMPGRFDLRLSAVRAFLGASAAAHPPPLSPSAVAEALEACNGNQSAAAERLRVDRNVVVRMINKHPELARFKRASKP